MGGERATRSGCHVTRTFFVSFAAALLLASAVRAEETEEAAPDSSALRDQEREQRRAERRARFDQIRAQRARSRQLEQLKNEIDGELAKEKPDRALLQQKTAEYVAARADRSRDRQHAIRRRWGTHADRDDVKRELERHAKTQARIDRLKFLVATERTGAARTRLLERLKRVADLESERYEQTMQELTGRPRAPSPSSEPPKAAPPATGAAH